MPRTVTLAGLVTSGKLWICERVSCMTASPLDLVSDMETIEDHWHEGRWLYATGQFNEEEWSEHEAITMSAMIVLGIDGMRWLGKRCVLEGAVELV